MNPILHAALFYSAAGFIPCLCLGIVGIFLMRVSHPDMTIIEFILNVITLSTSFAVALGVIFGVLYCSAWFVSHA